MRKQLLSYALILSLSGFLKAQTYSDQQIATPVEPMEHTPVYRVNVVSRTTQAVDYRHHSGGTSIDFRGTDLMPEARGHARVESRTGRIEIDTDFDHLRPSRSYGPQYLTYVLWAITPEGRPQNLGEIVPKDGKSSVKVSTDLQAFGLIVTAEPYFAVTRPSNVMVLENEIKKDTKGWAQPIDARFDALERNEYTIDLNPVQLPATAAYPETPTDLLEARNAVFIARSEGADHYAADTLQKAEDFLNRAEDYYQRKQSSKAISTVARGAVQAAEDARILSIRKRHEEQQEAERREMRERTEQARAEADQAAQQEAQARAQADLEAQQRAQAEREREAAERAKQEAEQARRDAEQARAAALAQQQAAQAQAQQAQQTAQQAEQARLQAEQDKEQTRARLMQQLNEVLQTRETARGLVVNMPDVLFDIDRSSLKPGARERLAKVAGILQAYPDLHVSVEGHTDSTGTPEHNQRLSENRANSVREFLEGQGVRANNIDSRGFGQTQPVASNDTSAGRQLNRRVDLVVTGEAIGAHLSPQGGSQVPAAGNTSVPATQPSPASPSMQPVPAQNPQTNQPPQ